MITDHRYDAGWPRDDSRGCITETFQHLAEGMGYQRCGESLSKHHLSEYPEDSIRPTGKHAGADGECPDYGSRYDPCPTRCSLGSCVYGDAGPKYSEQRPELVHPFID